MRLYDCQTDPVHSNDEMPRVLKRNRRRGTERNPSGRYDFLVDGRSSSSVVENHQLLPSWVGKKGHYSWSQRVRQLSWWQGVCIDRQLDGLDIRRSHCMNSRCIFLHLIWINNFCKTMHFHNCAKKLFLCGQISSRQCTICRTNEHVVKHTNVCGVERLQ